MASKKLTLSADGATAVVADATVGDIFTTVIDSNVALTGMYGFAQKAGLVVAGMAVQNSRLGQGFNPFK
jgi:hypothetical protein